MTQLFRFILPHFVIFYMGLQTQYLLVTQYIVGTDITVEDLLVKHNREVSCSCEATF